MKLGGNDRGEGRENGKRTEKRERERGEWRLGGEYNGDCVKLHPERPSISGWEGHDSS